ncbi:MAG: signal peptidase II [Bacilli bacterium]|nr:signal peptidase II [Bacilli bacterium]
MKKFLSVSFIIVIIDRIVKILVQSFLTTKKIYLIKKFLYLTYVQNIGAAFSIMEGMQFLLIIIGVLAVVFIYYYIKKHNYNNIGYSMLCGGIIGNLIDRIIFRYVIDYVGLEFGSYNFPIFNLADVAIVIGAALVVLGSDKNESNC